MVTGMSIRSSRSINHFPRSTAFSQGLRGLPVFALLILYGFSRHPAESDRMLLLDMCAYSVECMWPGHWFRIVVPAEPSVVPLCENGSKP